MKYLPLLFLAACATSPLPKVQHVAESVADKAVVICLEAHRANEELNVDQAKRVAVEAKIDSVCEPVLDGIDALTAAAASDAVAKMYSDLAKVLAQ